MQQDVYYNTSYETEEELRINFKKLFMIAWSNRQLAIIIFLCVLIFFIALTFILPKKYTVDADLYINKTYNSNILDINPYVIDEVGSGGYSFGSDKTISNEMELMQSPLVIDKVIRENNLIYKKKYGFIPNKKEGEYISTAAFLGKGKTLPIENKKTTNVIHISYTAKKPELAYNIVTSVIKNYIELHKEINSYKSKSDKKIIEEEYKRVKKDLDKTVNNTGGLPSSIIGAANNLNAMSAFSKSASRAMGNIKGQFVANERSRVELSEKATRVNQLSQKLEWAKLVENMSDTSKVLVLKEPQKLRDFEYSSPKLFTQIILGIIFGFIASLCAIILSELLKKKVSYSKLNDEIIYNDKKSMFNINKFLVDYKDQNMSCILFANPEQNLFELLSKFNNVNIIKAEISVNFIDAIKKSTSVILMCKIGETDADFYKSIKDTLQIHNKQIIREILI